VGGGARREGSGAICERRGGAGPLEERGDDRGRSCGDADGLAERAVAALLLHRVVEEHLVDDVQVALAGQDVLLHDLGVIAINPALEESA